MESGQVVANKYRLNQLLGSGGMAEVWSATNTFTERQLAIKFMNVQVAKNSDAAARFLKEAKVSARINHPNIIDIHDVGQTDDGQLFLVMELLTGFPLEVALRRQNPPMSVYEFVLVMCEVGSALAAAHKSGIVHRDLKPTNIFLHTVRDGVAIPKLLDFGVSKFLEDDQNHALTIAGTVLGSPLYMSPEQARGDSNLDGRTDVFAFGAILFEALCGFRAYEAKNFNALIVKIATTKPKNIDDCAPTVPESLRRIVRACMEVDLKKRVGTFEEIVAMLRATLPELQDSTARLPAPMIATAVVDPDATNALPVLRASDPPPSLGPRASQPPPAPALSLSGSVPPGGVHYSQNPTGPSWHTPNTSYASIHATPARPQTPPWAFMLIGAALVVSIGVGAAIAVKARRSSSASAAHAPTSAVGDHVLASAPSATVSAAATTLELTAADEPPPVSVNSLPGAGGKVGPAPRGSGRLFVTATPGWCSVAVDGKERGPTPVAGIDLPPGTHRLECRAPGGKVRTSTVTIQDGAPARFKFVLGD
jgi:serine/threonine protein kinase